MKYLGLLILFISCSVTDKYAVKDTRGVALGFIGNNSRVNNYHQSFTTETIPKITKQLPIAYKAYPLTYLNKKLYKKQSKLFKKTVDIDSATVVTQLNIKDRLFFSDQLQKSLKGKIDYIFNQNQNLEIVTALKLILSPKQQILIHNAEVLFLKQDNDLRYFIETTLKNDHHKIYFKDIHVLNYDTECLCVLNEEIKKIVLEPSKKKCLEKNKSIIKTIKIYDF